MPEMTPEATSNDQGCGVPLYQVSKIYSDAEFNCRGVITPIDVIDLARSIAKHGLQEPIVIRPRIETTPKGYDYVIVAGHRRHKSYQVNQCEQVPAILRLNLDEFKARTINAIENLKRKDLDILQEAKTVAHYKRAGWTRKQVSDEIGMSNGWVQVRFMVLELETEIQEAIAVGTFTQQQIRDIHSKRSSIERFKMARTIKEVKQRGDIRLEKIDLEKKKIKQSPQTKRARDKTATQAMLSETMQAIGPCLTTRALAWASGEITTLAYYQSVKKEADKLGLVWEIPSTKDEPES